MTPFSLAVANKLTANIKTAQEHFDLVEGRAKARKEKTDPWFFFSADCVTGSTIRLASDWLPMKEDVIMKIYLENILDYIQEMQKGLAQLNDTNAPDIAKEFKILIGMVAPDR